MQFKPSTQNHLRTLYCAYDLFWQAADAYVKSRFLIALCLVAIASLLIGLAPVVLKITLESFKVANADTTRFRPLTFISLFVLVQYASRCLTELRLYAHGRAEQRLRKRLSSRLMQHLMQLPLAFHIECRSGAIGETMELGIRGYALLLSHLCYSAVPLLVEFTIVISVLLRLNRLAFLGIFLVSSFAYLLAFRRGLLHIEEPLRSATAASVQSHATLSEALVNIETVKFSNYETVVSKRYDVPLSQSESAWRAYYHHRLSNAAIVSAIFAISVGTSLIYAGNDVLLGTMTLGDFVLVNAYIVRMAAPLEMMGNALRDSAQSLAYLERLLELFREKVEIQLPADEHRYEPILGALRFENVSFSYASNSPVLVNLSLTIPAGKMVAIVGASGSGKSSLLRLLLRLYEPTSGTIYIDDAPIQNLPISVVRKAIAIIPQDVVLFHDTLAFNIGFGQEETTQDQIEKSAKLANIHSFIMSLPEGYNTVVGERGLRLSGGERQRIAIARAVFRKARILVLDEATSSLDSCTGRDIIRHLAAIKQNQTVLVVAHDLSTVVDADEIIVLGGGTIVAKGKHLHLLDNSGYYRSLWAAYQRESSEVKRLT